jgi:hypothetical protein
MKKTLLSILLIGGLYLFSSGQNIERCSSTRYEQQKGASDSEWKARVVSNQEAIRLAVQSHTRSFSGTVVYIPVVVHVLFNSEEQNISDQIIFDQIRVLNEDYRRLNADSSLTRNEFLPVAADAGIEFYLAYSDPDGNPTNGITRTPTDQNSFWLSMTDMKSSANGGKDAWPVDRYLNIWVCNMSIPIVNVPFILGFATPPNEAPNWPANSGAETPEEDGVVIHYEVFGPNPNATGTLATVNRGRTATHEVGHYLGLRHIWGDGDCAVDDGLEDTPNAADANQQTCDYATNSCNDSPVDFPDMLENYMDYSDENCLNMFTQQQVEAMHYVIETFRSGLVTGLDPIQSFANSIVIYPNPCEDELNIKLLSSNSVVKSYYCTDLTGRVVSVPEKEFSKVFNTSKILPGHYFLHLETNQGMVTRRFIKK